MVYMSPETDGDECKYCNNYISHPFQVMLKEILTCKVGHEIVHVDGCVKCGKATRKDVADGKIEFCSDWIRSKAYIYDW